ncbi:prolyl endopeptidase-like [Puntigrus tetrazona]|uniref:prolyl endopeptidase-like n=1 Tax=Puntigrus tetrazona TaxID=1606681 RepID=UPI001C8AB8F2|nr:prolyl endopeptidase-like [Puntigrus tetrazona]
MNLITSSCLLLLRSVSRDIRRRNIHPLISRLHTETTAELPRAQLQKLRDQEQRFKRRLLSVHRKFAGVPENSEVSNFPGERHVYFEDGKGIYRSTIGQGEQEMLEVFNTDWTGGGYGTIQRVRLSPSETMLAVTVKKDHHEETRCVLVHLGDLVLRQKALLVLDNVFSFEWATDDVLLYSTQETLRCLRVFRLHLSDSGVRNTLVYEEKDPEFFVEVSRSRDQRLVTINCSSKISSEVWFVDSKTPLSSPTLIQARRPGLLYHVEHSDNYLFILANTTANQEYQLLRAPLASPSMSHWVPSFGAVPGTVIKDMELLQGHCVFTVKDSQGRLQIQTLSTQEPYQLNTHKLPHWACDVSPQRVGAVDRGSFGFLISSPVHPPVHYLYSPREQKLSVTEDNTKNMSLTEFNTTRLQAASQDGTMVPLTLLHTPALSELHKAPLLLHVYGAYGVDLSMAFCPEKRLLLEDGWALAYCHVRGGGERGLAWHQAGSVLQKRRGVEDLAACVQTLHRLGVSRPALTALAARSAGAVLAGALCNHNPQLLRAVILQAPFLDVLGTMQDPSLPLTVEERGEWGDPSIREHRDNIASYCPCHNIIPQLYPSMLITAYSEDRRVPLSGVVKYVERLKRAIQMCTTQVGANAVILDLQPGGDHFGPEDFHPSLNERAKQLAFLYTELGLDHPKTRRRLKVTGKSHKTQN